MSKQQAPAVQDSTEPNATVMPAGKPYVTVFIPTYFAGPELRDCLQQVVTQKTDFPFEVLIFDTSSTDETPSIIAEFAAKYPFIRTKTITKDEFGHGRTRQAAAVEARGDIVAYLTQDAVPADEHWLEELVRPFETEKVAGVLGCQVPKLDAPPVLKFDIRSTFAAMGPPIGVTLYSKNHGNLPGGNDALLSFYSDANSAARRSVLVGEIPYRDLDYAEDQAFGRDIIAAGYIKAYAPLAKVIHTNDITVDTFRKRIFDETVGLRNAGATVERISKLTVYRRVIRGSLSQIRWIWKDPDYSRRQKVKFTYQAPKYLYEKWMGAREGALVDLATAPKPS